VPAPAKRPGSAHGRIVSKNPLWGDDNRRAKSRNSLSFRSDTPIRQTPGPHRTMCSRDARSLPPPAQVSRARTKTEIMCWRRRYTAPPPAWSPARPDDRRSIRIPGPTDRAPPAKSEVRAQPRLDRVPVGRGHIDPVGPSVARRWSSITSSTRGSQRRSGGSGPA